MSELASPAQLRLSLLRWAMVTVPAVLLLGFISGQIGNAGEGNGWYRALIKPALVPPGWVFGVAWTLLYSLMGLALALILNARGARQRGLALTVFGVQLALNLAWSPLFFAAHKVGLALGVIIAMLILAVLTAWLFWSIRRVAGLLLIPYLCWLCFATWLNFEINNLNPDAEALVPQGHSTQIPL